MSHKFIEITPTATKESYIVSTDNVDFVFNHKPNALVWIYDVVRGVYDQVELVEDYNTIKALLLW